MNKKNPPSLSFSLKEELLLIQQAKEGDKKAKLLLYKKYEKLIFKMARQYQYFDLELSELITEGTIGFFYAIEKFNLDKKVRLDTYATWWIREKICKALREQGKSFKLSTYKAKEVNKVNKLKKQLTKNEFLELNELVSKIATELDLSTKIVEDDLLLLNNTISLDMLINETEKNGELYEVVGKDDEDFIQVMKKIDNSILKDKIDILLNELTELEKKIVFKYYYESKKPRQIAEELNIPYEQAKNLRNNAIKRLGKRALELDLYKFL